MKLRTFYTGIQRLLRGKYSFNISIDKISRIFPDNDNTAIVGLLSIMAIQCIWYARLDGVKPAVGLFEGRLKNQYRIEKYIAKVNNTEDKWRERWDGLHVAG